jgi:hypothetical protein
MYYKLGNIYVSGRKLYIVAQNIYCHYYTWQRQRPAQAVAAANKQGKKKGKLCMHYGLLN